MKKLVILVIGLSLVLAVSASAFNGMRKGFVLGGGLGFAPQAKWEIGTIKEEKSGMALNFIIGYGWDESNMIVYEGNVVGYSSDIPNQTFAQGFNGVSWYHYFGPGQKGAFTAVGLGAYVFDPGDFSDPDPGGGLLVGAGYQFSPHWQVGGYFSSGKTSEGIFDYDHTHFSILISTVAF